VLKPNLLLSTAKAGSGNQEAVMDQLKLALAWNRIDIAKSEIFTDDRHWSVSIYLFLLVFSLLLPPLLSSSKEILLSYALNFDLDHCIHPC
jgi:hypothetical protein